jgi:peptidoglycan L-alanyl-D-glutamate endopeptidase CwlK
MRLNKRSEQKLIGVDERLVAVVRRAAELTKIDFQVTCGRRTVAEQKLLVAMGKSATMRSYHIVGKAVDLVAMIGKDASWELVHYAQINKAMQAAAKELGVTITWGGSWKSFIDGPHWQIEEKTK